MPPSTSQAGGGSSGRQVELERQRGEGGERGRREAGYTTTELFGRGSELEKDTVEKEKGIQE